MAGAFLQLAVCIARGKQKMRSMRTGFTERGSIASTAPLAKRRGLDDDRRMRVRTKDYERQHRALWSELGPLIERVMFGDEPVLGEAVDRFEAHLARYFGAAHAVGMGSGTDAIIQMVRGLGLGAGDEVVTCAHTFTGVVSALIQAGVEPRLVDADAASGLLEVATVERALGPRTRAVLAVHPYGHSTRRRTGADPGLGRRADPPRSSGFVLPATRHRSGGQGGAAAVSPRPTEANPGTCDVCRWRRGGS